MELKELANKLNTFDDKKLSSFRARAKRAMTSLSIMGDMLLIAELTNFGFESTIKAKDIYTVSTGLLQARGKRVKL